MFVQRACHQPGLPRLIYLEFWSAPSASPAVRGMLWGGHAARAGHDIVPNVPEYGHACSRELGRSVGAGPLVARFAAGHVTSRPGSFRRRDSER